MHNALKREDKLHGSSCDRAQLPLLTLPFPFMKMDSGGEVRLWILHRLLPRLGFLLTVSSGSSPVWRASGRHVEEQRSFQEVFEY